MNDGGPAFPAIQTESHTFAGMTLRDWFAGQYLASAMSSSWASDEKMIARCAYIVADAMLAERAKGE